MLYNARRRKIEELDLELKTLSDSSEREARMLKHKLLLCGEERDGLKVRLNTDIRKKNTGIHYPNPGNIFIFFVYFLVNIFVIEIFLIH